ncbi:MAG: PBP1A family penicillin-binding protein [Geobacteraceae bacterium]|nr:PBP1A family penicillin-binding protein [Geobacteraceae bacterium]
MQLYQGQQHVNRRIPPGGDGSFRRKLILFVIAASVVFLIAFGAYFFYLMLSLPKVDRLADYKPPIVSQVFGDEGTLVGEFYLERRKVVEINKIPRRLIQAFVSAEDSNFYQHKGLDYLGIARAMTKNIIHLRKKEGASTITQQVAKSMLLTPEKKFSRKLKEAILATRMEKKLTKDEILYIYLNQIYMGSGAYGVQLAAETYFGKNVEQLNLAEMAMLAGLPKAPNTYSPIKNMDKAKERQGYVLERMVKEGYVTQAEADYAKKTPIIIRSMKLVNNDQSAYFLEQIRIQLVEKYGEERLYKEGLNIYTTMNAEMQRGAYDAIVNGLKALDKRQGFRGALKYLKEQEVEPFLKKTEDGIDIASLKQGGTYQGVVTAVDPAKGDATVKVGERVGTLTKKNMAWGGKMTLQNSYGKLPEKVKGLSLGSVIEVQVVTPDTNKAGAVFSLDQIPEAQAAIYAMDPRTGGVKAMVGGYDYKKSQFNRATQAKRNAGSAFKPIIYGAALEKGLTAATIIDDSPVEYTVGMEKAWKPKNYDNIYRGNVTMREALTNSINIVSIKILEKIGASTAVEFAKKLGITSNMEPNLALALGGSSLTPSELTAAYGVYASGGYKVTPYFITKVTDRDGKVLEEIPTPTMPVFTNNTAAVTVTASGSDVTVTPANAVTPSVEQKPATVSALPPPVQVVSPEVSYIITNLMQSVVNSGTGQRAKAVGRPVAAKTGTTNDMKDAWFVGFIPQLVAGVWVGFDQERSLGSGGTGGAAAAPIWTEFMQRAVAGMPVQNFNPPANVTFATINPRTGRLAREGSEGSLHECFISGTEPTSYGE